MFQFLVTVSQLCTDLEEDEAGDEEEDGDDGAHDDLHVEGWQVDHYRDRLLLHQHREVAQVVTLAHSPVMEYTVKILVSSSSQLSRLTVRCWMRPRCSRGWTRRSWRGPS